MRNTDWLDGMDVAVTVCNTDATIIYMNKKSIDIFKEDGGASLIGTNLLDCHPEPSKSQLKDMLSNETKNVYTIEKNGKKKLIYQIPYYQEEIYCGFIELSMEIPNEMAHFVRKSS